MKDVDLGNVSLDDVERMYQAGRLSHEQVRDYLRLWNAGPHFTQAVFDGDRIRNFETDSRVAVFYRHLYEEYGVRT